jgi:hypothetical protein
MAAAALLAIACPQHAVPQTTKAKQQDEVGDTPDVVVTASRPVITKGKVRRCTPQAGDPLDRVHVGGAGDTTGTEPWIHRYMAIVPRGDKFVWVRDDDQVTGTDYWQRVGVSMENYRFRGMAQDKLMCVGGDSTYPHAFAGFRREFAAAPYHGKRLRFTLWVATRAAGQVVFWLGSRSRVGVKDGGNTEHASFKGDHLWTPILLETGPVNVKADRVSYGFNIQGSGDVWVYSPTFEVVEGYVGDGTDRIIFGTNR